MSFKRKDNRKIRTIPVGIALGLLASMIFTLVGAAILAYMIVIGKIGENGIGYGSMVILAVSSALGTWIASGSTKRRRLMVCGISAACYYLILLGMTALFFGGQYEGMGVTALMVVIGSAAVVLLGAIGKNGSKSKHKIPAYR